MLEVEAAAARGEPPAQLALDVYTHRLVGGIAAMSAATGGLDVLVFTGGVGEHAATVRRNDDRDITAAGATVQTIVVTAREDPRSGIGRGRRTAALARAEVEAEPDRVHREQRCRGRPPHTIGGACPGRRLLSRRSHTQQRAQPGQRSRDSRRQQNADLA
jgi:hypothetical protein